MTLMALTAHAASRWPRLTTRDAETRWLTAESFGHSQDA